MPTQSMRAPTSTTTAAPAPAADEAAAVHPALALQAAGGGGNQAMLAAMAANRAPDPVAGVYGRIAGKGGDAGFDKAQLRQYLDTGLQFADGEWFRDTKLDGASDALLGQLDGDKNGRVDQKEFGGFEDQILQQLAPGTKPGASPDEVKANAGRQFSALDVNKKDGQLGLAELQAGAQARLPKGTDHADLVAQLGARIAIDALDTDQRDKKVADRTLSAAEWTQGAAGIASRPR